MPRCQRTFRRLGDGDCRPDNGARRWRCPYCPEGELYETVRAGDLLEFALCAETACISYFGRPADAVRPTILLFGLQPECVYEPADRRYDLYLQSGSDPYQLRLQIGHEMFHRVCSQGRIFHWTHEMFACLVSVRLLRLYGSADYANQMEREYARQAEILTFAEMADADLAAPPYPAGLYGRAFWTGMRLLEAVGWPALCALARHLDPMGQPDWNGWLSQLPEPGKTAARTVISP